MARQLSATFVSYASEILGDTNNGLSGPEIVKLTAGYAVDWGVDIPHASYLHELRQAPWRPSRIHQDLEHPESARLHQGHRQARSYAVATRAWLDIHDAVAVLDLFNQMPKRLRPRARFVHHEFKVLAARAHTSPHRRPRQRPSALRSTTGSSEAAWREYSPAHEMLLSRKTAGTLSMRDPAGDRQHVPIGIAEVGGVQIATVTIRCKARGMGEDNAAHLHGVVALQDVW